MQSNLISSESHDGRVMQWFHTALGLRTEV
jgi:hypothetical protein